MKIVLPLLALCALVLPQPGWAITPKEFDDKAIPLMSKPKDADKLLKICTSALAEAKNDPEFEAFIHVMKSHAHLMKKEYEKAEEDARIVIASGRQENLGHSALRDVLFARKHFDEGLEICLQGVSRVKVEHHQASARQFCHDQYLEATSVTPATLWNDYKKNPTLADAKYKGHPVTVLGEVTSVESSGNDEARVTFAVDKNGASNVVCMFNAAQAEEIPADSAAKSADGMAYSLNGETPAKDGKLPKVPATASVSDAKPGKDKPAQDLPELGEMVIISGKVRGMEANNVILVNCEKIR